MKIQNSFKVGQEVQAFLKVNADAERITFYQSFEERPAQEEGQRRKRAAVHVVQMSRKRDSNSETQTDSQWLTWFGDTLNQIENS